MKSKNYIKSILLPFLFIIIGILFSCKEKSNNKVQLFVATGAMLPSIKICDSFTNNTTIQTEKNFAASGNLARQIRAGAESDIYISANKQWIDFLDTNKLIIKNSISELAYNKLVVICPKNKEVNIDFTKKFDLKSAIKDKISIGDPKYVPVGKYAKQVLDSLNWYDEIQNRIILAKDVISVLHYVELGECDWGIVYHSEAIKSEKVKIAYEVPQELYDTIIFYIALLNDNQQSNQLYQYFKSDTAKEIFNKYGFTSLN
ncbi:MAG: molybdate ABC transporter substrate-binding protein [Bacteroidales bacterium]|nr:molybdate ABC transporter substrate-binding protein [Bacteroidales bacterium]